MKLSCMITHAVPASPKPGDRTLHHDWSSPTLAVTEARHHAEAELAALKARIAMLSEGASHAARRLLATRQQVARAHAFVETVPGAERELLASALHGTSTSSLTASMVSAGHSALGALPSSPIRRPRFSDTIGKWQDPYHRDTSHIRPAPQRSSLPPITMGTRHMSVDRTAEVSQMFGELRSTVAAAAEEGKAAEAAAYREDKEARHRAAFLRRAGIEQRCREQVEARRVAVATWQNYRAATAEQAAAARAARRAAQIAEEDAAMRAIQSEIAALSNVESELLASMRSHPALRLDAISPRSPLVAGAPLSASPAAKPPLYTSSMGSTATLAAVASSAGGARDMVDAVLSTSIGAPWAAATSPLRLDRSGLASASGAGGGRRLVAGYGGSNPHLFSPLQSPTVTLGNTGWMGASGGGGGRGRDGVMPPATTTLLSSLPGAWKAPATSSSGVGYALF